VGGGGVGRGGGVDIPAPGGWKLPLGQIFQQTERCRDTWSEWGQGDPLKGTLSSVEFPCKTYKF
jgi:hypothetical protein